MNLISENILLIKKTIGLYPLFWPRLYSILRSLILPISEIESILPKTGYILDVGCGYGLTTIYFALSSSRRRVKGIELESGRIKIAEMAASNIKNVSFMSDNLATKEQKKYQTIVLIDLLHHLSTTNKLTVLNQCFKLLTPNGLLVIKDINTNPRFKYLWNYFHDLIMTRFGSLEFYNSSKMITLLVSSGFKVTKHYSIKHLLYPHYLYVCKKS